ncbi:HEAT repeat domain-containing protein [Xanthomonas oryzae]|uniref:HEAT repeat domain-containing protein n=1 Tax=Xanthomonas oryzae TaxID=347 RepID=UPI000ACD9DBE
MSVLCAHAATLRQGGVLHLEVESKLHQAWYFHSETLKPLSIHASSVSAAIAQTLSDFLGTYGDDSSIDPLSTLLHHPAHFIRFAAARDLLRISLDAGREAFEQLAADPHPHVRRSAKIALSRLPRI